MLPAQAREHEISDLTGDNTLTHRQIQTSDSAHFLFPVRHGLPEKANGKVRLAQQRTLQPDFKKEGLSKIRNAQPQPCQGDPPQNLWTRSLNVLLRGLQPGKFFINTLSFAFPLLMR